MPTNIFAKGLLTLSVAFGAVISAQATDFRVENRVFSGKDEEPISESTTIFSRGVVYDFLKEPAETTVFDTAKGRFILLDEKREMKTELTTEMIDRAIERLKQRTAESKDPETRFLLKPDFKETTDEKSGELVFESRWLIYRVLATAETDPEILRQYGQFTEWYTRLNTFLRPGSRPPFARLAVNEVLVRRKEVPTKTTLIFPRQGLNLHGEQFHSEHQYIKHLVESDQRRIAQAGKQMAQFKTVSFRDYENRCGE